MQATNLVSFLFCMWTASLLLLNLLSVALSQSQHNSRELGRGRESGETTLPACRLPEAWVGQWNQAHNDGSVPVTNILADGVDDHGTCVEMKEIRGGKFLTLKLVNRYEFCFKYMLIIRVHENVLKYKEGGDCHDDLTSAQEDDGLYEPYHNIYRNRVIPCPFTSSSYEFTYNKGGQQCSTPVSRLQTCTVDSKRTLQFQACPDVDGTESIAKVLTCFGNWIEEDGTEYLFGELALKNRQYHEVTYRCLNLIRDSHNKIEKMAFPEDASCYPLSENSAYHPQIITLKRGSAPAYAPITPDKLAWFANSSQWDSLSDSLHLKMSRASTSPSTSAEFSLHVFTIDFDGSGSGAPKLLHVLEIVANHEHSEDLSIFSAIQVEECTRTPVCLHFYKRSNLVVQLSMYEDDNCEIFSTSSMNSTWVSTTTFIRANTEAEKDLDRDINLGAEELVPCPLPGKYSVTRAVRNGDLTWKCSNHSFNTLIIGCPSPHSQSGAGSKEAGVSAMQFYSCLDGVFPVAEFSCLASWEENAKTYVIVRVRQEDKVGCGTSSGGSSNDVTQNGRHRHRCFEIENTPDRPDGTATMTIKSNRNLCKRSYREDFPNEWEVTAVRLMDSSTDKLNSASGLGRPSTSTALAVALTCFIVSIYLRGLCL